MPIDKPFTCTEYLNYANQCNEQCNMCKDIYTTWLELEDKGIEVN